MTSTPLKTKFKTKLDAQPLDKSPASGKFSPEITLLLACSRTNITPELATEIKSLAQSPLDWQLLFDLGNRHQLIPLVYYNLAAICKEDVPPDTMSLMRNIYAYKAQTNLFITSELIKIHRLFQQHSITAIPFKGMTLAMTAYKNLSFRDSCDLDILIEKEDVGRATELLESIGYEMAGYIAQVKDNPELRYGSFLQSEANQKGYDFINPNNKIAIDLQWSLTEKAKSRYFNLSFEQLSQNTSEVVIADNKLPQFAPEVMVLYLCFHGSKHCWQSLKWICDLSEFIGSHPELDWQQIQQQAQELKLTTMLHLGLLLARDFYQTEIPPSLLQGISTNSRAQKLFQQVRQLIFARCFTQWEDYAFLLNITDSNRGKLRFLTALLFTPTAKEWDALKLPKSLFALYYLIRPYRLLREYLLK
ncbi:MAG: nucleotidyltransferase family protein [Cyanobacteria bacterium J06623_7]